MTTQGQEPLKFCAQCPSSIMRKEPFASSIIDVCEVCFGVWLDDGELQQIVSDYGNRFRLDENAVLRARKFLSNIRDTENVSEAENQRAKALLCPVCHGICFPTMYGFESGIIINRCAQGHGVFLDPTELESILVYSARLLRGSENVDPALPPLSSPGQTSRVHASRLSQSYKRPEPTSGQVTSLDQEHKPTTEPKMRTTRRIPHPQPIDVRVTVSQSGTLFFEAIRSPQGMWYPAKKGGTVTLANETDPRPHYWVELENGGALVVRQDGFKFEWVLVGAGDSEQPDSLLTTSKRTRQGFQD